MLKSVIARCSGNHFSFLNPARSPNPKLSCNSKHPTSQPHRQRQMEMTSPLLPLSTTASIDSCQIILAYHMIRVKYYHFTSTIQSMIHECSFLRVRKLLKFRMHMSFHWFNIATIHRFLISNGQQFRILANFPNVSAGTCPRPKCGCAKVPELGVSWKTPSEPPDNMTSVSHLQKIDRAADFRFVRKCAATSCEISKMFP